MKKIILATAIVCVYGVISAQTMEWVTQLGNTSIDRALSVTTDGLGNTYTTGIFRGIVDFDPGPDSLLVTGAGSGEAFILKLDAAGNLVKALTFGNTASGHIVVGSSISLDASGNIYTAGYYTGSNVDFDPDTSLFKLTDIGSGDNAFVQKLDASGKFLWAKRWFYGLDAGGNNTEEKGPAMALDVAGNVYTTGRFNGITDFDPGDSIFKLPGRNYDGYVSKLNTDGEFVWAKHFAPDTSSGSYVFPQSISVDAAGDIYIAGFYKGTVDFNPDTTVAFNLIAQAEMGFIVKLNASGNFAWAKRIGNDDFPLFEYDVANAVTADAADNSYVTGSFMGTVTFDAFSLTSTGNSDIFIAKLDPSGNYLWAQQYGTMYDGEEGSRIKLDADGNLYTTGIYRGTVDFNPGSGVYNLNTNGSIDVFVLKLTPSGSFVWAKGYGGANSGEVIGDVAVNGNAVYTVGKFTGTVNFDPNGTYNLTALITSSNWPDAFIHKMNQSATGIAGLADLNAVIYPNPTANQFVIDLSGSNTTNAVATLFDTQGRKVQEATLVETVTVIDVEYLQQGLYFVKIQGSEGNAVKKLMVK